MIRSFPYASTPSGQIATLTLRSSAYRSWELDLSGGALKAHDGKMPSRFDEGHDKAPRSHLRAALGWSPLTRPHPPGVNVEDLPGRLSAEALMGPMLVVPDEVCIQLACKQP